MKSIINHLITKDKVLFVLKGGEEPPAPARTQQEGDAAMTAADADAAADAAAAAAPKDAKESAASKRKRMDARVLALDPNYVI